MAAVGRQPGNASPVASLVVNLEKESEIRSNSGSGKGKNNLHDPHLKDLEREKGVSGEAIHGEKKVKAQPDRKSDTGVSG